MQDVSIWLRDETAVKAAFLFGSSARMLTHKDGADTWSDLDLHVVTTAARRLERMDWNRVLPNQQFCLQVARPATGGGAQSYCYIREWPN